MRSFVPVFAVLAFAAAPAIGQSAPQAPVETAKPKMVTKEVCQRIKDEATIGSRVAKTRKVCKKVEVPADPLAQGSSSRGNAS